MFRLTQSRFLALQALVICAILVSAALLQVRALKAVEIGSPAYREIVDEKDLIADTLPPPLFVTEAYGLALESAVVPERARENAVKIESLHKDFLERKTYWASRDLPEEEKDQLETKVEPSAERFWSVIGQQAATPEDSARRLRDLSQAFYTHRDEVIRLVEISSAHLARSEAQAASTGQDSTRLSLLAAATGLLVSALGALLLYRRTVHPVVVLTDVMERMARGDLEVAVPGGERRDEIGSMARVMEVFREAGADNLRLQREAEAMQRRAETDRRETQARAEAEAAERLRQATSGLARGLDQLACGDLSRTMDEPFAEEFEILRRDFNNSVRQLCQALGEISGSVQLVDREASGICEAAEEIGQKTEFQAAALTETAAALTEIAGNVRENHRRTEEARRVAEKAAASATQSAGVVREAVSAMQRIEGSSQRISNIIGVIDEIAFQTNLLALNAGVEAARAGAAGKGFAVVAQEVRELAQRTGRAAREIKDLIETSSGEVAGGVSLVRRTGDALTEILGFIVEVNKHTEAIHGAMRDQASGLSEVDDAVHKMEETTRGNASMVERQIAAADNLAQEASRLASLMERFRLREAASDGRAEAA